MIIPGVIKLKIARHLFIFALLVLISVLIYFERRFSRQTPATIPAVAGEISDQNGGSQPSMTARGSTSDWIIYQNTLINYRISYPPDWSISEEGFDLPGTPATPTSPLIDIYPSGDTKDFLAKITIECFPEYLLASPPAGRKSLYDQWASGFKSWELENKNISNATLNGLDTIYVQGEITQDEPIAHLSRVHLFQVNQGQGVCAIIIRDNLFGASIYDQILSTFKYSGT